MAMRRKSVKNCKRGKYNWGIEKLNVDKIGRVKIEKIYEYYDQPVLFRIH